MKQFFASLFVLLLVFTAKAGDFPRSHLLIVGVEEYAFAPELPRLINTQAECQELAATLVASQVAPHDVVSLCGAEATGTNIIEALTKSLAQVQVGENVVLILRAHGAVDSGAPGLMASDMFNPELLAPTSSLIDIGILRQFINDRVPPGTKLFVYLDSRESSENLLVYRDLPLRGLNCSDFAEYTHTTCIESDPHDGPNKTTIMQSINQCLGLVTQDGPVAFGQFNTCMTRELAFMYEAGIQAASVELAHDKRSASEHRLTGPVILGTGGVLALSSAVTYSLALGMKSDVFTNAPRTIYTDESSYLRARNKYRTLRTTTYGLLTASVVLAGSGTVIAVTPHGASIGFKW